MRHFPNSKTSMCNRIKSADSLTPSIPLSLFFSQSMTLRPSSTFSEEYKAVTVETRTSPMAGLIDYGYNTKGLYIELLYIHIIYILITNKDVRFFATHTEHANQRNSI